MWCTRWYLPLLLLPLPIAPPYFLVLFLLSLTLHAKPCFYCIVLLTTLLISSCYWQPFPIDSPLSVPWSENITTFAEALNATLAANYTKPLPSRMRVLDRCWCDFSSGKFFEPFNITNWEYASVQRMKQELERPTTPVANQKANSTQHNMEISTATEPSLPEGAAASDTWLSSRWRQWLSGQNNKPSTTATSFAHGPTPDNQSPLPNATIASATSKPVPTESMSASGTPFQWFRPEYDLQPYGLGMVIDLRWS